MKAQYLITDKPLSIGAMAAFPYSAQLEAKFFAEDRFGETFNISKRVGDLLMVPRELAINAHYGKDLRTHGAPVKWGLATAPPRNDEQARVYAESLALLKAGKSHIIKASTGFGKTWLGVRLARAMGLKTLIVVTKEDLLSEKQWLGALRRFGGLKDSEIGIIQQKKVQIKGKVASMGMVHTLAKGRLTPEEMAEYGLIIFDEVHRMGAETFEIVAGMFPAVLRLGLSAGASGKDAMRIDGKDIVFEGHIGEVKVLAQLVAYPPKILVLETPYKLPIVPRKVYGAWKQVPLPHEPGKLGAVLVDMAKCMARNQMIVDLVVKAYNKGRWTIIFSDLAEDKHLTLLHDMAVAAGIPANLMGFYVGGMKEKEREITKTKRVIWSTYGMAAEATDIPRLDTCVLATPRANVKQPIGRILRELEGKPQPIIFDLVDYDSTACRIYFKTRQSLYLTKEIGGKIVHVHLTKQENMVHSPT